MTQNIDRNFSNTLITIDERIFRKIELVIGTIYSNFRSVS